MRPILFLFALAILWNIAVPPAFASSSASSAGGARPPLPVPSGSGCPDDPEVAALLKLPPIHERYIRDALRRSDVGIAYAHALLPIAWTPQTFLNTLSMAATALSVLVDTELRLTEYERDLKDLSSCLHVDLAILEAQIEKVRCEMKNLYMSTPAGSDNNTAIWFLRSVAAFLNERYRQLLYGAMDLSYIDDSWGIMRSSDRAYLLYGSYDGEPLDLAEMLGRRYCPFHTDYLPPVTAGWGCDGDALAPYTSVSAVAEEAAAIGKMIDNRDAYLRDIDALPGIIADLYQLQGRAPPPAVDFGTGAHLAQWGCNAGEGDPIPHEDRIGRWPEGAARFPVRGAFSIRKDDENILVELGGKLATEGHQRPPAEYLRIPDEFPESEQSSAAASEQNRGDLVFGIQNAKIDIREKFSKWSETQGAMEARALPMTADTQMRISETLAPLRREMGRLSAGAYGLSGGGLRSFTRNYAWFLRHSCIFRPCNTLLDRVLKLVLTGDCFPYTTGAFLTDTDPHQRRDRCKDAADL